MTETTRFRDVIDTIVTRITKGPWGPGTLLPSEIDLAAEFGCSRSTMNRALRDITEMGLIERKRKAGTRVRLAPLRAARFEMPLVRADIELTGATYRYALIHRALGPAPDWLCAKMQLPPNSPALHLICVHYANDRAFQIEDRWINLTALPAAELQDFSEIGPNEWLIATVPFSEVEISFLAKASDALTTAHLGHALGAPVFCIERATWWQRSPITFVTLSHGPNHRLTTRY
jgi:GntR family histidine utilization transcriptional repressor